MVVVEAQVAYAVVGHYSRKDDAEALSGSLGASLSMDDGSKGSLTNHDAAWELAYSQGAVWCVVLEDDALPIEGFKNHVQDAIRNVPRTGAISFYTGSGRPKTREVQWAIRSAQSSGAAWLMASTSYWGPALALPSCLVPEMLRTVALSERPYDERFGAYLKKAGLPCFYTYPSLVDHADNPSLLSDDSISRKAHQVGVPNWNPQAVRIL